MIAFYGAKGGVGATTIAINTAIALHAGLDRKVALVDAVLQFGDHRVFLDLGNDRKSVTDLMAVAAGRRRTSSSRCWSSTTRASTSCSRRPARRRPTSSRRSSFAAVLAMLRSIYDYVIVDVDKRLGDLALSILDHADEVHIVMTADLSCLKNVRLVLEALRKVGFDPKRLKLVLNRSNAFTGVSVVGGRGRAEARVRDEDHERVPDRDLRPEHGLAVQLLEAGLAAGQGDRRARAVDRPRVRAAGRGRCRRPGAARRSRSGPVAIAGVRALVTSRVEFRSHRVQGRTKGVSR